MILHLNIWSICEFHRTLCSGAISYRPRWQPLMRFLYRHLDRFSAFNAVIGDCEHQPNLLSSLKTHPSSNDATRNFSFTVQLPLSTYYCGPNFSHHDAPTFCSTFAPGHVLVGFIIITCTRDGAIRKDNGVLPFCFILNPISAVIGVVLFCFFFSYITDFFSEEK